MLANIICMVGFFFVFVFVFLFFVFCFLFFVFLFFVFCFFVFSKNSVATTYRLIELSWMQIDSFQFQEVQ